MDIDGGNGEVVVRLDDADRDALRILRAALEDLLRGETDDLIARGQSDTARRCWDGIAVLDRLTDGGDGPAIGPEERALVVLRIAHDRGWTVSFRPDGMTDFCKGAFTTRGRDFLRTDVPIVALAHAVALILDIADDDSDDDEGRIQ